MLKACKERPIIRIGTAGWAIPAHDAASFEAIAPVLARYATRLNAVEINSSFHRPHRRSTYERWAACVPPDFRFSVKLPKAITHEQRLKHCDGLITQFADEVGGLGPKRGPVLVQLPPSLVFDTVVAHDFFERLTSALAGAFVCEPRHPSWFAADAEACLVRWRIARVAADPSPVPGGDRPAGLAGLPYYRLHGAPKRYWSAYSNEALASWAARVDAQRCGGEESWIIFDNTAAGAAMGNALALADRWPGIGEQGRS